MIFIDWNIEITTLIPYDYGEMNHIFKHECVIRIALLILLWPEKCLAYRLKWVPFWAACVYAV